MLRMGNRAANQSEVAILEDAIVRHAAPTTDSLIAGRHKAGGTRPSFLHIRHGA